MVSAATLGDVMKKRGQEQQLRLGQPLHDVVAQRKFLAVFICLEASQITDDKQCVLIDRIDVKKVVLHTTHDVPECGNIPGQNAVSVHPAQFIDGDSILFLDGRQCIPAFDRMITTNVLAWAAFSLFGRGKASAEFG